MSPRRLLAVFAVATMAALPVVPAGAQARGTAASHTVHHDAVGDVARYAGSGYVGAPNMKVGDIRLIRVRFTRHAVHAHVGFRDLIWGSKWKYLFLFRIHTSMNRERTLEVSAYPGRWRGRTDLVNALSQPMPCHGARTTIRYRTHVVSVSVPRRCLGSADWVRVGMAAMVINRFTTGSYLDNAYSKRANGRSLILGPRVTRP